MKYINFYCIMFLLASCALFSEKKKSLRKVVFSYEALSAMDRNEIPRYVYVFPPLKSNVNGKPIEKMVAIPSFRGGIKDWKTTSSFSINLRDIISASLMYHGYEVVTFEDLLSVKKPYSVLTVSTFYSLPVKAKNKEGALTDEVTLVLVKGALFDENLDPKSKKEIIQVNGSLKIPLEKKFPNALEKAIKETFSWFGDHCTGMKYLDFD